MSAKPHFNSDSHIPQTQQKMCDCGNDRVMPGYRVCASCASARRAYPHLWPDDPPDNLDTLDNLGLINTHKETFVRFGYVSPDGAERFTYATLPTPVANALYEAFEAWKRNGGDE